MKNFSLLTFCVFCLINLNAQVDTSWVRRFNGAGNGDDKANSIAIDLMGNVYVAGESYGLGTQYDFTTVKYNPNGEVQWVNTYAPPGIGWDIAKVIKVDTENNVYVAGHSWSQTLEDYTVIKYNTDGDEQWKVSYNGSGNDHDYLYDMELDNQGNVYVTGSSDANSTPGIFDEGYLTIKYNSDGDTMWIRRYDGPVSQDIAYAAAIDQTGNIVVTGTSQGPRNTWYDFDYATIKYNPNGDSLWVRRYNGPGNRWDEASAIATDNQGNIYVAGKSEADSNSVSGFDYLTIKYNSDGVEQWVARYNGTGDSDDEAKAIALDIQGNVYITGKSDGVFPTGADFLTIKYTPDGDTLWIRRYNGPGNGSDVAECIAIDTSGNVYVSGYGYYSDTYKDYLTVKYNTDGDQIWIAHFAGTGGNEDAITSMAIDGENNVYVTGFNFNSGTEEDYLTIKYVQSTSGTKEKDPEILQCFFLYQNHPNPFNPSTVISYQLPVSGELTLKVFDILGNEIATLVDEYKPAGRYKVEFGIHSDEGRNLSSGIYFYQLKAGTFIETKKMILLK